MLTQVLHAASGLLDFQIIVLIPLGVIIGIVCGALPGISASVALALFLPLSFVLAPLQSLVFLGAIYMAAEYGGSISAILINTPGTPGAMAATFDGYPMAREGRALEALYASILGSATGGILGMLVLLFFTPWLARLSLKFESPEMFWLAMAGLAIVANLSAENFTKGVIGACIGLAMAMVGQDLQTGVNRFTFGIVELEGGIKLVPTMLGLFAVAQMLMLVSSKLEDASILGIGNSQGAFWRMLQFYVKHPFLILRSSIIGIVIGILPGAGASVASFVSYSEAKRYSKEPERFGKGTPEALFAVDCANNGMVGGSLVPLFALGIPGSASAAIMLGALIGHGITPGMQLFMHGGGSLVYTFILSLIPTTLFMLVIAGFGARWFAKVIDVKVPHLVPIVMALAIIGSYSSNGSLVDVFVTFSTGLLGYLLLSFRINLAPVVLGFVLGPMAEEGLRRTLELAPTATAAWATLFGRPICIILILITATMIISAIISSHRRRSRNSEGAGIA